MDYVKTALETTVFMSIGIICLFMLTPQGSFAQQGDEMELGVYGYPLNVSTPTPEVKERLDALASGFKKICKKGRSIEAFGYSDYHKFKGVSKRVSDRKNDILAWDRLRQAIRYLVDQKSVPEYCFDENDPVYADSDVRGVKFRILSKPNLQETSVMIQESNTAINKINQKLSELKAKNDEQDKKIEENRKLSNKAIETANKAADLAIASSQQTSENEADIKDLEKNLNVSAYLGVGMNVFAGEAGVSGTAGIRLGQIDFSGWYSYAPDVGVFRLEPGVTQTVRRESYGGSVTWYGFSLNDNPHIEFGPMIKFEHGENIIKDREAYVAAYESISGGMSMEFSGYRSLYLRANIAYAPIMKTFTNVNQIYTGDGKRFSGGITLGVKL